MSGAWIPPGTDPKVKEAIWQALDHIMTCEEPLGSNRGPIIDAWNLAAGVPLGSYWCGSGAGAWYRAAGLEVPRGYARCENWHQWAKATSRWSVVPVLGGMVLYRGKDGLAHHIGLVIRITPLVGSVEGNTTIESGFSSNGIAVANKIVAPPDPILGYVLPYSTATGAVV